MLPQALRVIIPPLTSQYLNLTKNSSLAVAIGYPDLVSIANTSLNQTGRAVECIAIIMAVYLTRRCSTAAFMNWYNRRVGDQGAMSMSRRLRSPSSPRARAGARPRALVPWLRAQPVRRLDERDSPRVRSSRSLAVLRCPQLHRLGVAQRRVRGPTSTPARPRAAPAPAGA